MILTVAHSKGGVGKSTLAWNLANALKKEKNTKSVEIIDLDFQQTLYFLNLLAGNRFRVRQPTNSNELLEILDSACLEDGEYIIIDTGGFDIDINRVAVDKADKVLVPLSPSPMDILGFETFKATLENDRKISIVLNNIHPLQQDFTAVEDLIDDEKIKLLKTKIRQRKIYKTVLVDGGSVFEGNDLRAINDIKSLLDEILGDEDE